MKNYDQNADFDFFLSMLEEWLTEYMGQVALIHDQQFIGMYDTLGKAVESGLEKYGAEHFIAARIENIDETQMICVSLAI